MKTILAPIDFSEVSRRVLVEAVELARAGNARLVILHVVQPPMVTDSDIGTTMSAEYSAMASAAAAKRLKRLEKQVRALGCTVQTSSEVGFPGARILQLAEKLGADTIVLGSHGHGAFYDLVVGSTTTRILKAAQCPVMVVPAAMNPGRKAKSKRAWEPVGAWDA